MQLSTFCHCSFKFMLDIVMEIKHLSNFPYKISGLCIFFFINYTLFSFLCIYIEICFKFNFNVIIYLI